MKNHIDLVLTKENFLIWKSKDLSTKDIEKITGFDAKLISAKRRFFGIEKFRPSYQTSKDKKDEIISLYVGGLSSVQIKEKLQIGLGKIFKALKEKGIKIRSQNDLAYSKHNTSQTFFDEINTEEKAYILGFIYADGSLRTKENRLTIGLSIKDVGLLEKIKSIISPSSKIFFSEKTKSCKICLNGKNLRLSLEKLGVSENKTFTLKFPDYTIVPEYLFAHFIRGYFDGDGGVTLSFSKKGYPNINYNFVGNKQFVSDLDVFLKQKIVGNRHFEKKINSERCFSITCRSKNGFKSMYDFLYTDAYLFLKRKKEKFEKCMELRNIAYDKFPQVGF